MNSEEQIVVEQALNALHEKFDFDASYAHAENGKSYDGTLDFKRNGSKITFVVECKREVRDIHLAQIFQQRTEAMPKPLLLIAGRISPRIKQVLQQERINYLEANANANIDLDSLFIRVEGEPAAEVAEERVNRAFTKTGLKVLFLLLSNPEAIKSNYREIAMWTGVSLGNVTNVFNGLKNAGHLVAVNQKEWKLTDTSQLLQKWVDAYEQRLKPTLELARFRFLDREKQVSWKQLILDTTKTLWSGEPAAEQLIGDFLPATLTLYTTETKGELMAKYKLVPDASGDVRVYTKFWKSYPEQGNIVPPILVYADLIATRDSRSLEAAAKIYESKLKPVLE